MNGERRAGKGKIPEDACHRIWKLAKHKRDAEPAFMGTILKFINSKCLPVNGTEHCRLYTMCCWPSVQIPATQKSHLVGVSVL